MSKTMQRRPSAEDPGRDIGSLAKPVPALSSEDRAGQVARRFEIDCLTSAFAILRDRRPVGLIDRLGFMSRFATRYGRDLYANKPIARMMEADPLILKGTTPIEQASQQLFQQKPSALRTGFIVVDDERRYLGIVTGLDLLQALAGSLTASNQQLRDARDSLVQSEKMAALGALVAGVAHEVNTPIGSALTAATAFEERARAFAAIAGGGAIRRSDIDRFVTGALEAVGHVQSNIRRASDLITGFKQIAVDQTCDQPRCFDLRRCLDDVLMTLQPQMRKASVGHSLYCPDGLEIEGYPGALTQIVSNLIMNALMHAFAEGTDNRITVVAALTETIEGSTATVHLSVADNGCGIPEEIRPRIFDPFFTTRRGSGGSGLGLHIVYNLVTQRLGGSIAAEDVEGGGTRFVLSWPAARRQSADHPGSVLTR